MKRRTSDSRVQTRHPQSGKSMPRIAKTTYDSIRRAILKAVPSTERGTEFRALPEKVSRLLPKRIRDEIGSVGWYTTTVKLDLEARGEIERVPGSRPQRLRRPR